MPNWCSNRIELSGEDTSAAVELLTDKDGQVTFDKIAPMPIILKRVISPTRTGENGRLMLNVGSPISSKQIEATPAQQAQIDAAGIDNWFDWAVEHWGTKWDAYRSEVELDDEWARLTFDTAWSPPEPVIEALRQRFPDLSVSAFFDEPGVEAAGYY